MPDSGNSWQQLVMGLFEIVQCRGATLRDHADKSIAAICGGSKIFDADPGMRILLAAKPQYAKLNRLDVDCPTTSLSNRLTKLSATTSFLRKQRLSGTLY